MVRIYLNPEVSALAKKKPDPAYIDLPPKLYGYDILKNSKGNFGQSIIQYADKYNFYLATLDFKVSVDPNARGVKWVILKGRFISDNGDLITVDDIGPKTSWVDSAGKLEVDISVNFDEIKKIFELVKLPDPVTGKVNYKWTREKKVPKIITGRAGEKVEWTFSAVGGEYIDGGHTGIVSLRSPKNTNMFLEINYAEALYDYPHGSDTIYYKETPITIPVERP